MELKNYQQEVLYNLAEYIKTLKEERNASKAFSTYWKKTQGIDLHSSEEIFHPYCDSMNGIPNVTVKVPTAGGKTFIACNAMRTIFDAMPQNKTKAVAWFVPSDTILKQTYKNLKDPQHPYRQKIDTLFNGRVEVYDKQALLGGQSFNPVIVKEQLSIFVLSIQSFAAKATDKRLVYSENENLMEFVKTYAPDDKRIDGADESSLIQVLSHLNPVMIIDESHNFEGDLRIETLANINPCFILNLTATPRKKSNIISFVSPASLKRENMVKLPVMVSNYQTHKDVINCAISLRNNLENKAKEEEMSGGDYIRPIVLFQAQPKNDEDNVTFITIKNYLVQAGIPEEEIKIKTANLNELTNVDLMSRNCPVRYIITINALKEGWDCPFAYILASTANRSSQIDVEQILGRILRQPYTRQHGNALLNMSYVLTSSANFNKTIDHVVESLRMSGYSRHDYIANDTTKQTDTPVEPKINFIDEKVLELSKVCEPEAEPSADWDFKPEDIFVPTSQEQAEDTSIQASTSALMKEAEKMSQEYEQQIKDKEDYTSEEIMQKVITYPIRTHLKEFVANIKMPQFYIKTNIDNGFFGNTSNKVLVTQEALLENFNLSNEDKHIEFTYNTTNIKKIDIDKHDENSIIAFNVKEKEAMELGNFYENFKDKDSIITQLSKSIRNSITQDNSISEGELHTYITGVLRNQDLSQLRNMGRNLSEVTQAFKTKIKQLKTAFAKKQFESKIRSNQIVLLPTENFPAEITLTKDKAPAIDKKLYEEEEGFNDFERTVIEQVISLDCVKCWHRNQERGKGFCINGFINAYPDFIIVLNNGITVMLETKGKHLDGTDSQNKVTCGDTWSMLAGDKFFYYMVFEEKPIKGAVTVSEFINSIIELGGNE